MCATNKILEKKKKNDKVAKFNRQWNEKLYKVVDFDASGGEDNPGALMQCNYNYIFTHCKPKMFPDMPFQWQF
jgi:hypothetical protein